MTITFRTAFAGAVLAGLTAGLTGCSSITSPLDDGYELGATTRTYCESVDPAVRKTGRLAAERLGTNLPDLCNTLGIEFVELEEPEVNE